MLAWIPFFFEMDGPSGKSWLWGNLILDYNLHVVVVWSLHDGLIHPMDYCIDTHRPY